jgi:hypothetical protein
MYFGLVQRQRGSTPHSKEGIPRKFHGVKRRPMGKFTEGDMISSQAGSHAEPYLLCIPLTTASHIQYPAPISLNHAVEPPSIRG